ncbi:hypothetical protein H2203_008033 [Taxawa tesnikishii (nom. ined.)]|nr:hypothetical protein H2203_008033 [Dothideales sp. JES 119]
MFARTKTAPSGYEKLRIPFHALRTAQLISSLVVGCIMLYFCYHLTHDHWNVPWTFIVLTVVSILTVFFLTVTIILHCCFGLNPAFNLGLNTCLFVLWGMGFGMLAWWMWGTLTHYCDVLNWNDSTGIMVCRIYKALFTFSLLGLVSTICALGLDLHIHRLSARRGRHHRLEDMDNKRRSPAVRGPYTDDGHRESTTWEREEFEPRNSEAFEVPKQSGSSGAKNAQNQGYSVPEGQFDYDTGYHGGHAERVFGHG